MQLFPPTSKGNLHISESKPKHRFSGVSFSIDELLEGGLMTGKIYEICGLPASGKTQFCLTLAKNVSHTSCQKVYYIDTKRDFSARRLKVMLESAIEVRSLITKLAVCIVSLLVSITERNRRCSIQNFSETNRQQV